MASPLTGGPPYARPGGAGPTGRGCTVLLRGDRGVGRSALAAVLGERLRFEGHRVEVFTEQETTVGLTSAVERREGITPFGRLGFVAALLARNRVKVLCPFPAHDEALLASLRAVHRSCSADLLEVYLASPQPGVALAAAGEHLLAHWAERFTGSEPPDLVVPAGESALFQAVAAVYTALIERGLA